MNKVLVVIFCLFTFVNVNAQTSQKDKNQQSIDDLWKRINNLENSGKLSPSDMEAELGKLRSLVKLQQDSIDKLNGILSQIKNLVNGGKTLDNSGLPKGTVCVYYHVNLSTADYATNKGLDSLINAFIANKGSGIKLKINGHADNTGNAKINDKLSKERALNVKKYLVAKGIAPESIVIKGFGSQAPANNSNDPAYFYLNRRVEVFIEK